MPQLIVDPITAILKIDTNIVTKYLGRNKDIKQNKKGVCRTAPLHGVCQSQNE